MFTYKCNHFNQVLFKRYDIQCPTYHIKQCTPTFMPRFESYLQALPSKYSLKCVQVKICLRHKMFLAKPNFTLLLC